MSLFIYMYPMAQSQYFCFVNQRLTCSTKNGNRMSQAKVLLNPCLNLANPYPCCFVVVVVVVVGRHLGIWTRNDHISRRFPLRDRKLRNPCIGWRKARRRAFQLGALLVRPQHCPLRQWSIWPKCGRTLSHTPRYYRSNLSIRSTLRACLLAGTLQKTCRTLQLAGRRRTNTPHRGHKR